MNRSEKASLVAEAIADVRAVSRNIPPRKLGRDEQFSEIITQACLKHGINEDYVRLVAGWERGKINLENMVYEIGEI